jgi:hypothetical protein
MASGRVSKVKGKVLDIPTVPTIGTATAGGGSASVAFTASTKGGTASTYTALSNPGSVTASGASSPVTVTGLTVGTAYTFTVRGNNSTGSSEYSSASNSVTPTALFAYESIATVTLSSNSSSITFSSIPQTYKHLQVRALSRDNRSGTAINNYHLQLNGDGGTNYSVQSLFTDGSTVTGAADPDLTKTDYFIQPSANTTSGVFAVSIWDILDYSDTNKYKTIRAFGGYDNNGAGRINFSGASWRSTSGVTSLTFTNSGNNSFIQYTSYALYGIKG